MTFEDAKNLLVDMRTAKRRANSVKARITDLESDYESINSALGSGGIPHGSCLASKVEQMALRVLTEREKHMTALEKYFILEDQLSVAIECLDAMEQEIIIGCYVSGKMNFQLAQDLNYSERSIIYKKNQAIRSIAWRL